MREVDESKYRKRKGRPNWKYAYDTKIDTRVQASTSNALDRLAEKYGVNRSTLVRKALEDFIRFNEEDGRKRDFEEHFKEEKIL